MNLCVLVAGNKDVCDSSLFLSQPEECLEKVINDTECLFKTREKEYQETIDQIEVRHSGDCCVCVCLLVYSFVSGVSGPLCCCS